jgi:hypothetical protein
MFHPLEATASVAHNVVNASTLGVVRSWRKLTLRNTFEAVDLPPGFGITFPETRH